MSPRNVTELLDGTCVDLKVGQKASEVENLKLVELSSSGSSNTQIMEWENKMESFVETLIITEIKGKITSMNYILIWGPPGCGKTTSVNNIAMYLQKQFDFLPVHCDKPSDIFRHNFETGKRAFLIDDICGRFVFSHERFLRWKRREKHLKGLSEADNVKILMTCSSAAFMTDIVRHFPFFTENAFELTTPSVIPSTIQTFTKDTKRNIMLTTLIEQNILYKLPLPLIKFGISLPLSDVIRYFIDSSEYFINKLEELQESNRSAFYSLFICVLKTGSIDEAVLTSDDHRAFTEIRNNVFDDSLNIDISRRQFLDNLYFLMDIYLSKENSLFSIQHTALFEILAVYFGEKRQKMFIRCADPEIITQHCILKISKNIAGNARFSIHVSEENEHLYFQRITERLLSRNICEVFSVRQMSLLLYRQKLVAFLKNKGPDVIKQISRLKCKIVNETPLLIAVRFGYVNLVKLFSDHNEDLNPVIFEYLEDACDTDNVPLVKLLVNKKININRNLSGGCNALHIACKNGSTSLIHFLVKNGADVNCTDKQGNTPLIEACRNENESVVSLLLKNESEINKSNLEGLFPLMIAANKGKTRLLKLLISNGADVNKTDFLGYTCLMRTIQSDTRNSEALLTLLNVGVDVNCSSADGKTALLIAVQEQRRDIVIILIDYATGEKDMEHAEKLLNNLNANIINKCDNHRITPLMYACELRNDQFDVVKYLISKGAIVNCCDKNERTPLIIALENNDIELVQCLINNGANVNIPGVNRTTPLHAMCKSGQVRNVLLLISKGSEVDIVDRQGMTPLMVASKFGYSIITQALFHTNAKIDTVDKNGTTALMFACMGGFDKIIRFLVENGADVNIKDSNNWTALLAYISSPYDKAEIVQFLIENGADVNSSTKDDVSSLMMASFRGKYEVVKSLLRHNVDVNHKDVYGKTPIFSACLSGNIDIVRVLMENGADATVVDNNGDSPEILARKNNLTEMVIFFGKK
ncbi:Hypothetical predicted protein [Mytilus galloprovincialis]|uniref:Novel STAND NTPase 3 domain-containing protein n=1 Tax=Mytilus galloprovincialis TaxID=29158 RepID=A0A8B6H6P5_MYTGA|nr:Hypothetical predicted protein [Mytilus galloprovincialis]